MDFTGLSDDELANALSSMFAELHAREAKFTGAFGTTYARLVAVAHGVFNQLQQEAQNAGVIQKDTGGDPKP